MTMRFSSVLSCARESDPFSVPTHSKYAITVLFTHPALLSAQGKWRVGQTTCQPNDQSAKRPVDQTTSRPNDQSAKRPVDQTTSRLNDQSAKRPVGHMTCRPNDFRPNDCNTFVGYSETSKGYRTINRFRKKLNIARVVVFLESSFHGTRQTNAHLHEPEKSAPDDGEEVIMWKLQDDKPSETEADKAVSSPIEGKESSCCDTVNEDARTNEGRPKRNRVPNRTIFNSDFVVYEAGMYEGDPVSYADAIRRPDAHGWLAAVDEELAPHRRNHSWDICSLPEGKKATKVNGSSRQSTKSMPP
ncbi:hypothetical protein M513_13046 [Trichuris suis]|uniref:Retroviral polymerase SH3-like domain-containing protein n=1 Tax=Trichuris suis TaxID=68888 RepID=A0A085LM83_9BILA|nr:hypothetical protein M513_13046 [Trichuris suis]